MFSEKLRDIANTRNEEVVIRELVKVVKNMAMNVAKSGGYKMVYPFDMPLKAIEILRNEDGLNTILENGKLTLSW